MRTIIVFFDSLNKQYLPVYNPDCDTIAPNFERLARKSVTFDKSFVGSMPCMPARRELHTGRYNFLHREWGPLEPFDDSMPEMLRQNGIYTHLVSDHLHYWEDGGANYHTRYSSWEIVRGQEGDHWKGQVKRPEIPPVVKVPQQQTGTGESGLWRYDWVNRQYITEEADFPQTQCFEKGCEFIQKNHAEDQWLLQVETFDPHEPFYVPQKYLDMYPEEYEGDHFDWPRGAVEEDSKAVAHCLRQYKALVTMCDHNLGKILDMMDTYEMWDDTMLIVGTDHGFLLTEHGYWGKNQMPYYNEIANNPLFIWDPRSQVKEERRSAVVQMIDWAPTILEANHLDIPDTMQGKSLTQVITEDKPVREYALYGVFSGHVNITDGRYTYMRAPLPRLCNEIYNYTLIPQHMNTRYSVEEMQTAEMYEMFSFTKGCPVMRIKGKDKYKVGRFGNLLFDTEADPQQMVPLEDKALEKRMEYALISKMAETDSPPEQFTRLGLSEIIERRNIKLRETAAEWEEAIRKAGLPLVESGYIWEEYIQASIDSVKELGPYIVIMPGLALAHTRPDGNVIKSGISILTLKTPVEFDSELDPVQIVVMLAAKDENTHLEKLQVLAGVLDDADCIEKIKKASDEAEVYELIHRAAQTALQNP